MSSEVSRSVIFESPTSESLPTISHVEQTATKNGKLGVGVVLSLEQTEMFYDYELLRFSHYCTIPTDNAFSHQYDYR